MLCVLIALTKFKFQNWISSASWFGSHYIRCLLSDLMADREQL